MTLQAPVITRTGTTASTVSMSWPKVDGAGKYWIYQTLPQPPYNTVSGVKAAHFDGSGDYITVGNKTPDLDIAAGADFTAEFWINTTQTAGAAVIGHSSGNQWSYDSWKFVLNAYVANKITCELPLNKLRGFLLRRSNLPKNDRFNGRGFFSTGVNSRSSCGIYSHCGVSHKGVPGLGYRPDML